MNQFEEMQSYMRSIDRIAKKVTEEANILAKAIEKNRADLGIAQKLRDSKRLDELAVVGQELMVDMANCLRTVACFSDFATEFSDDKAIKQMTDKYYEIRNALIKAGIVQEVQ